MATIPHSLLRNTMRFLSDLRFENTVEFLEANLTEAWGSPRLGPPESLPLKRDSTDTVLRPCISYRVGFPLRAWARCRRFLLAVICAFPHPPLSRCGGRGSLRDLSSVERRTAALHFVQLFLVWTGVAVSKFLRANQI